MNISLKQFIIGSVSLIGLSIIYYRNLCEYITFDDINKKHKKNNDFENKLQIYSIAMPKFFTNYPKKKKCLLLIGGYRDIPYIWNDIEKLFILDGLDYYAPRTFGNGRTFFQISDWKDWIITYYEAMCVLENQYESVDIIGFSTGTVIALYLSEYKYKCKINNIFLCAPFLLYKPDITISLFFSKNPFSYLLNRICTWTLRFRPKFKSKFAGIRDTYNPFNSINDYYEIFGDLHTDTSLFDFIKFRPKNIYADNVIILNPNDDDVIGNIHEQHKIISDIFNKHIDLITIPSYCSKFDSVINLPTNLPTKCAHVMFKENSPIIHDIYNCIKKYL